MKKLIIVLFAICLGNLVNAQDFIVKKNGDEIKAKVLEVTQSEIKYKNADNPDGPSYTITKADVFMIKYQNGTKDIINPNAASDKKENSKPAQTATTNSNVTSSDDKSILSISYGISSPLGDYGSNDPSNSAAGLAQSGKILNLFYSYKIGKYFGLCALLQSQANNADAQALANALSSSFPTYSWSTSVKGWSMGTFMIGGYESIPIGTSGVVNWDDRLMIGYTSVNSPDFTVYGTDGINYINEYQPSVSASAFCYDLGIGLRFNVGSKYVF